MNAGEAIAFRERARAQWDRAAEGWERHGPQVRDWLRTATDAMLDMAEVRTGRRVLDVAAGAGDQTLDIAHRVGPTGQVVATDLSPAMLALALAQSQRAGLQNVVTQEADAEDLPLAAAAFDSAVCRLGLMLVPRPLRALRELHRVLRPGAAACALVFGSPQRNPCIGILMATALEHAGLPARNPAQPGGLASLGGPGHLDTLFREAGFRDVASTRLEAPFCLPSARHYIAFVRASASPIQGILGGLDAAAAQRAWQDMEDRLQPFQQPGGWVGPNELLLTAGRR